MTTLTERARAIFANDLYATTLTGVVIDNVEPECTICSLQLTAHHRNAKNAVMGGVFFTLADLTFAIAAHTDMLSESESKHITLKWVSTNSNISFLAQPHGDSITARSTCIKKGRSQAVYQISITDSDNRLVAIVTTTGLMTAGM